MAKIKKHSDIEIKVTPHHVPTVNDRRMGELGIGAVQAAQKIVQQIERHVDNAFASVSYNTYGECEFCESPWWLDFDGPAGPTCCDKAREEWAAAEAEKGGK